jgi:hypothetical protein
MADQTYDVEQFATHLGNALQFLKVPAGQVPDGVNQTGDVLSTVGQKPPSAATPQHGDPLVYSGGYSGSYQGDNSSDAMYSQILSGIGAPVTPANLQFMQAWHQAEYGNTPDNRYNPFNTTQGAPGAFDMNSVGVKGYTDEQSGVSATVQTLQNGYYQGILDALQQGTDPMAAAYAVANSPWGTGGGVINVLGGG